MSSDPIDNAEIDLTLRSRLERRLACELKSCIDAHGPITKSNLNGAVKRLIQTIKVHNRDLKSARPTDVVSQEVL